MKIFIKIITLFFFLVFSAVDASERDHRRSATRSLGAVTGAGGRPSTSHDAEKAAYKKYYQDQMRNFEFQLSNAQKVLFDCKEALEKSQQEVYRLEKQIAALKIERSDTPTIIELRRRNSVLREQNHALQQTNEALQRENRNLKQSSRQALLDLEEQNRGMVARNAKLRNLLAGLEQEKQRLNRLFDGSGATVGSMSSMHYDAANCILM